MIKHEESLVQTLAFAYLQLLISQNAITSVEYDFFFIQLDNLACIG